MNIISQEIDNYIEQHTSEESDILQELNRETYLKILYPQMLSGKIQGEFLIMISKIMQPKRILEIGTFTGYSAICLAQGLAEKGQLFTIDINEELSEIVNKYISKASLNKKVIPIIGDAIEIIPTLNETFDLVFIDADKINYSNYYDLLIDKVRSGGLIIADNVLWSGKVTQKIKLNDKSTIALKSFNQKVQNDPRIRNVILSVRDGLMMCYKV